MGVYKWSLVPIGECTWDKGGYVHERVLSMCTDTFPYLSVPFTVTDLLPDSLCRSGISEVDGSDPPFLPPGSARWGGAPYNRVAPLGRVAPVPKIPAGR